MNKKIPIVTFKDKMCIILALLLIFTITIVGFDPIFADEISDSTNTSINPSELNPEMQEFYTDLSYRWFGVRLNRENRQEILPVKNIYLDIYKIENNEEVFLETVEPVNEIEAYYYTPDYIYCENPYYNVPGEYKIKINNKTTNEVDKTEEYYFTVYYKDDNKIYSSVSNNIEMNAYREIHNAYTLILNQKFPIPIERQDNNGNVIEGVTLELYKEGNNSPIDTWVTSDVAHVSNLIYGNYILKDVGRPVGISKGSDIRFSINKNGELTCDNGDLKLKNVQIGSEPEYIEQNSDASVGNDIYWRIDESTHTLYLTHENKEGYNKMTEYTYSGSVTSQNDGYLSIEQKQSYETGIRNAVIEDVIKPSYLSGLFSKCYYLEHIENLENIDLSNIQPNPNYMSSFAQLFRECFSLDIMRPVVVRNNNIITAYMPFLYYRQLAECFSFLGDSAFKAETGRLIPNRYYVSNFGGYYWDGFEINDLETTLDESQYVQLEYNSTYTLPENYSGSILCYSFPFWNNIKTEYGNFKVGNVIFPMSMFIVNQGVIINDATPLNIQINKIDDDGNQVIGATLKIYEDETELDSWVTDGTTHTFSAIDGTYTLKETIVPEGYEKAEDVEFKISDGKVYLLSTSNPETLTIEGVETEVPSKTITVIDEKLTTKIIKMGASPVGLSGATLQILKVGENNSETLIHEWITDGTVFKIDLVPGDYILRETQAPEGYSIAEDIPFTVNEDKTISQFDEMFGEMIPLPNNEVVMIDDLLPSTVTITKTVTKETTDRQFNFKVLFGYESEMPPIEEPILLAPARRNLIMPDLSDLEMGGAGIVPTYNGIIHKKDGSTEEIIANLGEWKDFTLGDGEYVVFEEIPKDLPFEIVETPLDEYKTTIAHGDETIESVTYTGTVTEDEEVINYTNENLKKKVVIKKDVTGSQGERDKQFIFKLFVPLKDENLAEPSIEGIITRRDGSKETVTINVGEEFNFSLADDETLSFERMEEQWTCNISENTYVGYDTSVVLTSDDASINSNENGEISFIVNKQDAEVLFINDRDLTTVQTGINIGYLQNLALVLTGFCLVLALKKLHKI